MRKFSIACAVTNGVKITNTNPMPTSDTPRILFLSRAYPPVTGGIENQNYEISRALARRVPCTVIANKHGKRALPLFLPYALIVTLWNMRTHDVLLLGDGVLGIIGGFVKIFYGNRKKVLCIVHGLDLTFNNNIYQNFWVKQFIPDADRLIAVGNQTIKEGVTRGIPEEKFVFVPNGVDVKKFALGTPDRKALSVLLKKDLSDDTRVLFTGGRLVKRKGVAWFIRTILPTLPDNIIYAVAGDGPDRTNIEAAIRENGMQDRVVLLGYVSDDDRRTLLHSCDLFIQPNIPVEGDMEGFGLVVLEAGSSGIVVVASRLEGLKDAIHDGKNGILVPPEDADAWKETVITLLSDDDKRTAMGRAAHEYITKHFTWDAIAARYVEVIEQTPARR